MNEKFNKDEVWGHLGKGNNVQEDGDHSQDEDDAGSSKFGIKVNSLSPIHMHTHLQMQKCKFK